MVAAVADHGFPRTTVSEVVAIAGVSKTTFYQHFENKQACFLDTFQTIVDGVTARVGEAYRSGAGPEERLAEAFSRFAEIVCEESEVASFVIVDSLSLGAAAVQHRRRAAESFERMIRQSFRHAPGEVTPSDLAVRLIVAGVESVVYRCLREGCPERLAGHLGPLSDWALSLQRETVLSPIPLPPRQGAEPAGDRVPWDEPPDSPLSRSELTQRERMLRAVAQVAAEVGYEALSVPAISAAAGTSNQTFYEHFDGKREAFIAAFDELTHRARRAMLATSGREVEWFAAIQSGVRSLLEFVIAEPLFARLAFFELPTAGAEALDHADATIAQFTAFLGPGALPESLAPVPPVIVDAIAGGTWAAIQHEIAGGRGPELVDIAPELAAAILAPVRPR
jgi:AcrR family transcriptional regulator